jgi:hypothetical protein
LLVIVMPAWKPPGQLLTTEYATVQLDAALAACGTATAASAPATSAHAPSTRITIFVTATSSAGASRPDVRCDLAGRQDGHRPASAAPALAQEKPHEPERFVASHV